MERTPTNRLKLLRFFSRPQHLVYWSLIFTKHISKIIPDFHKQIYQLYILPGNKGVAAPRGFAKSTITDVVTLAWYALFGKKHFILLISDTYTQATTFLEAFKNELETNALLKWLFPGSIGELWTDGDILVNGFNLDTFQVTQCRITAKGAGMKVRGLKHQQYRPDLALIDDLENDENVGSEEQRRKLRSWLLRSLLPALSKTGEVIYICTILHFDSLGKNIVSRKDEFNGWKTVKYQALTVEGDSLWPEHYTAEELTRMRDDPTYKKYLGPLAFSQEMQNEPLDDDIRIFKADWLEQKYSLSLVNTEFSRNNPEEQRPWVQVAFKKVVTAVDPAISEKDTADFFALITIGITNANICSTHPNGNCIYVLDYYQDRIGDITIQAQKIVDHYNSWREDTIKIETVAFQKGLYSLVQRLAGEKNLFLPLQEVVPDKDKKRRALIHSANFAGKLVHLRDDHPQFNSFLTQLLEFPLGVHDDMLDAYMHATEETTQNTRGRMFAEKPLGW